MVLIFIQNKNFDFINEGYSLNNIPTRLMYIYFLDICRL